MAHCPDYSHLCLNCKGKQLLFVCFKGLRAELKLKSQLEKMTTENNIDVLQNSFHEESSITLGPTGH